MNDVVVQVQGLSKLYRVGQRRRHDRLRDLLAEKMAAPFRRGVAEPDGLPDARHLGASDEQLWALRDVSFEVRHGEVIGIVGANGAGKSTLLKILSRITEPTSGRVEMVGRLGSLLEVGTGFNPDLTGRENVYLNGAILGMKRAETRRRFDEIVEFAEIERFIDTPVKRYSSGMHMRLAFAVAAHLEPDILIVDEVLAVGDASFQRKCLGKMGNAARSGRTVLFVSHNMLAVEDLCDRVIRLDEGRIVDEGWPKSVISGYLQESFSTDTERLWKDPSTAPGNDEVRLYRACARPEGGSPDDQITVHTPFLMEFEYRSLGSKGHLSPSVAVYNENGIVVFTSGPPFDPVGRDHVLGMYRYTCKVPGNLLNSGMYQVALYVGRDDRTILQHDDTLIFDVQDTIELRHGWHGKWGGAVRPVLEWTEELVEPY